MKLAEARSVCVRCEGLAAACIVRFDCRLQRSCRGANEAGCRPRSLRSGYECAPTRILHFTSAYALIRFDIDSFNQAYYRRKDCFITGSPSYLQANVHCIKQPRRAHRAKREERAVAETAHYLEAAFVVQRKGWSLSVKVGLIRPGY